MELMVAIYFIFFGVMGLTFLVLVGVIAGKDIYLAFRRWFSKKGCEVYLVNLTRTVSHYFMIPKDGVFRIGKLPYVTNPEKAMNLTEEEKKKVLDYMLKRTQRLKGRILEFNIKITNLKQFLSTTEDEKQTHFINSQIAHYENLIKEFKDKLRTKQENYFKDKRPAFFYIYGDPIPKDFYEYYSTLDSKMVDNLVSRSLSQPPAGLKQEGYIKQIKIFAMGAAIAAGVAAIIAFRNSGMILEICRKVGATCAGL